MSSPMTPPAGLASGAPCLPPGAWSTRPQITPHAPPPPPDPKAPQRRARHTHRPGGIALPRGPPREVRGLSAVRHALRQRQPGAPNPVEPRRDGCADRGPGRPGEALTQTKPNPPPQTKKGVPGYRGGYGGLIPKNHWGIIFGPKIMISQGVTHQKPCVGVCCANDPKKTGVIRRPRLRLI